MSDRAAPAGSTTPVWWIVFSRELRDLWVGGKALILILLYSVLLGIYSYMLAANAEVNLLPLREMILEMVKASIAVGLFICLIIAADSFSGERERGTLETVLLTPASRVQIMAGKFLAALSPWPVALAIAIPYWGVLSKGDPVFGQALLWGAVMGTILAPALAGLGMLVSVWCSSNKSSMLISLCVYIMLLLPTELSRPGRVETAAEVRKALLYAMVNPWDACANFLGKIFINRASLSTVWMLPTVCLVFAAVVLTLLFLVSGRRLRLDPAMGRRLRVLLDNLGGGRAPAARAVPPPREYSREPVARLAEIRRPSTPRPRPIAPRVEPAGTGVPTWWVVFRKELGDLWIGGKALYLTIAYTIVLGVYTYVTARDSTLSLVPPKEMVYELTKSAMVASVFVALIIGADSLSGERERATLEGLLLTPTSRLQIVVGKFLAAASPGPAALLITIPYMRVLSQGDEVFGQAVLWGAGLGCVLTFAFSALAMFVGFWCNSNKTSLFISLCLYLLFLLPTQLPGHAQGGTMGLFGQWMNPLAAPRMFLSGLMVNNWAFAKAWSWLVSPAVFAVLTLGLLFWYAGPNLRLEAGRARRWIGPTRIAAVLLLVALAAFGAPALARAQQQAPAGPAMGTPLGLTIDAETKDVRAGTPIEYHTVVTNNGAEGSPGLIVAMNIVNLSKTGDVVDPEDWSPQRTQYVDPLGPGQSATLAWRINAILDGDYMVYMVAIPAPAGPTATSHPIASPGIHVRVSKYTRLNPGGVLPYAIGGPVVLGLIIFFVYKRRHREIDAGGGA